MKYLLLSSLLVLLLVVTVSAAEQTVCCEKTTSGLFCQNTLPSQCAVGSKQAPTSCDSTSFCKPGVCYGTVEGLCQDNTPQVACNAQNASWSEQFPAQCALGCCTLGDQAAFVSLVRCKRLSSFLGIPLNYNKQITDEVQCVLSVQNQDKGACVYESDFEKTCITTTRAICSTGINGSQGTFYKDKLCTAPELGTTCERTRKTTCVDGRDGVYFVDSCGNPTNIYDVSKVDNVEYWSNMKQPEQSCAAGSANINSETCGNCDYLQGSICRQASASKPTYGDFICTNLNCASTSNGKSYKHGESWCAYTDAGKKDTGKNPIGSQFFKHICINGEEVVEACADYRQQECIEDKITVPAGTFSQAACRVNRWQECIVQTEQKDCENKDRRDCLWKPSMGSVPATCVPQNAPGLQFWQGDATKEICNKGSVTCSVIFEKGLLGGEECKQNCECLTSGWLQQRNELCNALGDCGPNVNWLNQAGYNDGYKVTGP